MSRTPRLRALINLTQQQRTPIGADLVAIETGNSFQLPGEIFGLTACSTSGPVQLTGCEVVLPTQGLQHGEGSVKTVQGILLSVLASLPLLTVASERVKYPYLGVEFTVPEGWRGVEAGDTFIMGSETTPGLIVILRNGSTNPAELRAEADNGIVDDGVQLSRSSGFDAVGVDGLGAQFTGFVQGEQAKAYIVGLVNPFGSGLSIGAVTSKAGYSNEYQELALSVAESVAFALPEQSPKTQQWVDWLPGRQLLYLSSSGDAGSSYTDSSGQVYSSYSSSSSRRQFDFCSNNRFHYYSSEQMSFDNSGGFGHVGGAGNSGGEWAVNTNADGSSELALVFDSGAERAYTLDDSDGRITLEGTRYFRQASSVCR